MQSSSHAFLVGALVASLAVTSLVAALWLSGDQSDDTAGAQPIIEHARAATSATVPGRKHVTQRAATSVREEGVHLPSPTVDAWVAAECGDGEELRKDDGAEPRWWDFPLDDVMAALLAVMERNDELAWSGVNALKDVRDIGYLAAPWAQDVARYLGDPALGSDAVVTLAALGPDALPVVLRAAHDEDARIREQALLVLTEANYRRREVVEIAIAALSDPDADVRAAAVEVLAAHDEAPDLSVPALTALVPLPGDGASTDALFALRMYGPRAAAAVPGLVRIVSDPGSQDAETAVATLRAIGPAARTAVPSLLALLASDRATFGKSIPEAVLAISPDAFLGALSHADASVRAEFAGRAGTMLAAHDEREEELVTSLDALTRDPSPAVRRAAARGLSDISSARTGRQTALATLRKRLAAGARLRTEERAAALDAVAAKGPLARSLAPALREFLHDPDDRVRLHAALAVWTVDPPAVDVEPILRSYQGDAELRAELYSGLFARPPAAWAEHVAALLHDEPDHSDVRSPAFAFLLNLGDAALPALARLSERETRDDRIAEIADLLRAIGPPAAPALHELAQRPGLLPPLHAYLLRLAEEAR